MINCDKLKLKAIIGVLCFTYLIIGRIVDISLYIGLINNIALAWFFIILGLYLLMPYVNCLKKKNDIGKPPFSK